MSRNSLTRSMLRRGLLLVGLLGMGVNASMAAYPDRPIKIIVTTGAGGLTDITSRLVAKKMSENLGQPIIVENRPGGGGVLAARVVKNAKPDGYTLLTTAGTIVIQPAIKLDPGYHIKDFAGVGPMLRSPLLMVTSGNGPDKTLQDFIARAKAHPGKMSYASAGVGSTTHIGAALFLKRAGLDLMHIPYNGNGPAMPDVIGGRIDMIFEAYGSSAPKIKSGILRALAVTSTSRLPDMPNVPTFAEQGFKGFSYYLWLGMLAPAGTPAPVLKRLSDALHFALQDKKLQEYFRSDGAEAMVMAPAEFDKFLQQQEDEMAKVVADLGIPKN